MKLQIKVTFLIITILIVIGITSGGIMLHFQRENSVQLFEHMATALARAVQGSLEHAMLTGQRKPVQEVIARIGEEEMVGGVILLSTDGKIIASKNISEIGNVSDSEEVQLTLRSGQVSVWIRRQNGNSELNVINPVLNKPECQVCHSLDTTVLGGIQVSLDTTPLDNQLKQQTIFFGVFGGLALLIIGIGLAFALRKIVLQPLFSLAESAQRLSQGDYAARTWSDTNDEIGMLARIFDEMAASVEQRSQELEASRKELARWNIDLETRIEQRTEEITALNLKLEEMNRIRERLVRKLISAQEEERRRIARELHDEASQSLAALVLHLGDISDSLTARHRATKQRLDVLKEQAVRTLKGVRNLALELRPSVLDHLGLPKAIEWYVKDYLGKRDLETKIDITEPKIRLPSYMETILFRIVQEALTNVIKHAQASQVAVKLELANSKVSIRIEDNGKGFNIDTALSGVAGQKNLGLHGMIERATLLGGTLNIHSEAGKGTRLSVEVPFIEGASNEQD